MFLLEHCKVLSLVWIYCPMYFALTVHFLELHNIFGDIRGVHCFRLPFQIHRTAGNHGRFQNSGWLRWLLHLQLHQLLIIAIQIAGATKIWSTIAGIHHPYLQLGRNTVGRGLLFHRNSAMTQMWNVAEKIQLIIWEENAPVGNMRTLN